MGLKNKIIGVFGGGFKPPTKGHFEVLKTALDENPEIDEMLVFVGKGERDGITQEESLKIWEIYGKYLPFKVKYIKSTKPPIQLIYNTAKLNPESEVLWIIGAREDNEEDFADIASRTKGITKYPNLELRTIVTKGGVSGTAARNAAKVSKEKLDDFLPEFLSEKEKQDIFVMLSNTLTENASYSQNIDLKREIAKLTKHMLDQGKNITPLPKLIFKNGDSENAKEFLGKTAYYDPNSMSIVLYTEGRHPKDIVRSFSHEIEHHIQNIEGRLGNITTTNTQEDDHLNKLEQEANLKGTMTFRNWTDSLNENMLNELNDEEIKYWALYANIFDFLNNKDFKKKYQQLLSKLKGEPLKALNYFYNEYFIKASPLLKTNTNETKDPFGLNAYAMELGRLREEDEKTKYIIYCDLDGVLVDFDKGYKDLTGKDTKNADRQGSEYFWGLYRDSLKEKGMSEKDYFENLPWESDGKELWNYIEKYNPFILTAPSVNRDVPKEIRYKMEGNQSMQGKAEWVKRLNNVKKTLYKSSKFKHQFASRNRILIDDRKDTIDRWNNAGGIGILHTDTKNTINQLQDLGL